HNLAYQGVFPKSEFPKLGLPWDLFHMEGLEYYDQVNLLKGGLLFAKRLTTVSPTYAREIQTPEYGCGLEGVLRKRHADLTGVLNGLDIGAWDPATDTALAAPFSAAAPDRKAANKGALQRQLGLPVDPAVPLLGMTTRLAAQKGLDLVAEAADELVALGTQLVVLGTGDRSFHEQFEALGRRHPTALAVRLAFDDALARQIYAGADLFLMPSRFEPCGLGQMIAMRYGAMPIVRRTGGLADTVTEASPDGSRGNGFLFEAAEASELLAAVRRALAVYRRRPAWAALQRRAMQTDWSWERAARAYVELYGGAPHPVPSPQPSPLRGEGERVRGMG
ncbi:MAG: glycogen/starch synthase, partial [Candidatus Omnitrophica bacterium]|nr:glycogen/starch synthase [Candidatus Omnitrophota bacterium]